MCKQRCTLWMLIVTSLIPWHCVKSSPNSHSHKTSLNKIVKWTKDVASSLPIQGCNHETPQMRVINFVATSKSSPSSPLPFIKVGGGRYLLSSPKFVIVFVTRAYWPPTTRIKKGGLKHLLAFWENVWTQTKSTKTPTYCWAPCLEDCSSRLKYYVYIIMNRDWSCMFIFCNFGHVFHFLNLAFVQPAARTQLGTTVQTSDVWCQPQETDSRRTLHPFPSWWNGGWQLSTAADPSCFMASEVRL